MARILLLETSTATLSVALSVDGVVVQERICTEPRQQASLAAPLVKEVLDAAGLSVADCHAVCVSKGPGSYTGLRVGRFHLQGPLLRRRHPADCYWHAGCAGFRSARSEATHRTHDRRQAHGGIYRRVFPRG